MFRFSVLLAFLFAALFGPSKATPFKKKGLRRRVEAPAPVITNGLAALDANHLVMEETAVRDDSDSDSDDDGPRRRRRRGGGRCRRCRTRRCRRRCRRGSDSDSDSD